MLICHKMSLLEATTFLTRAWPLHRCVLILSLRLDHPLTTSQKPPLYLHITSQTKEGLEAAVAKIEALIQQDLPNLIDERRFRRREPEQVERDEFGRVGIRACL
jgi:hypothetical protein